MNIFKEIEQLDIKTGIELASFENEYGSNEYEINQAIDIAIEEFIVILGRNLKNGRNV